MKEDVGKFREMSTKYHDKSAVEIPSYSIQ
jgi:hypothetical protein